MQAPGPRSIGGTRPGRISSVRNVETPMESGDGRFAGERTVTKADPPVGEERPRSERQQPKGNGNT
jgi:hypothetical protein